MQYFQELKSSLRLALPLIIALLAQIGIGVVDSIMMGYMAPQALAAGALALGAYMLVLVFSLGLVNAVGVCIAQARGAQQHKLVTSYLQQGGYFTLLISIPMVFVLWYVSPLFLILQQKPAVVHLVNLFLHGLVWGYPSVLGFILLREFVSSFSKPLIIVLVSLLALPLNVMLDYGFIFGAFHFPRWGMFGIGVASSLVEWLMLLVVIVYVFNQRTLRRYARQPLPFLKLSILKELFKIGTPMGFIYIFEAGLFTIVAVMMGWLGTTALAAYQILLQCLDVAFMFFLGIAQATALRVAFHMGAKQYKMVRSTMTANMTLGLLIAAVISLVFYFYSPTLITIFIKFKHTHNEALKLLAQHYFKIAVIFVFFDAVQVIANNGLRGMKDTFVPMWLGLGSYWLVGISCAAVFAFVLGLEGTGLWIGMTVGVAVSAVILAWRWWLMINRYVATIYTHPT